ncbi:CDP-alcohol phosphatidyltransferase family protein [Sedimenticola hydrogenitrophicus]|uniref:CDP-alcohol phosphatidyltransferase family protein n=1 Tax=Sedimenticola hydrogenitrophicus TaxID=2967975 RepID=UPI0021A3574F|nr:CDP-alcohol phosphatidyltransferase family protein [Sedimenticola hydrogenitrophicus]
MPSIYDLKPAFQGLLRPLCARLAAGGITPNQITLAALLLSLANGTALALYATEAWPLLLLPAVLLVRMALNALDGMLAREHGMQSRLGAVLNELGDVLADTALYLPLALVPGVSATLVVLLVFLAILTEFAGIQAIQIGAERRYDGPFGKSDRALLFGAIGLLLGLGLSPGPWLMLLLALATVLALLTVLNRVRHALLGGGQA